MAPRGWMVRSLAWRLSQPGFDPSNGKLMSSHTDEFWWNETDLSVDDYIYICVWLNDKDTFLDKYLAFWVGRWIYWNCPERFRAFYKPSSGVVCESEDYFFQVFMILWKLHKRIVGLNLDADHLEQIENRTLSTEIEYHQEK